MTATARLLWLAPLLVAACAQGTDHELMGDRRYAEHAWVDAAAEYRLAARQRRPSLELRAKLASAALHAGDFTTAVEAWRDLGAADASAVGEAADGLMRTARAAIASRDVAALRAAVTALRSLAPTRLPELGSALLLALAERPATEGDLVLVAAAGARGAQADSLLAIWGDVMAHGGGCDAAIRAYAAVMRRAAPGPLARSVRGSMAVCRVELGRAALSAGNLDSAEAAFRAAIALGTPDSTVRLAWVLVGDVRWAGGDTTMALESYRKAIAGAEDDNPIAARAREQMQRLTGNTPLP